MILFSKIALDTWGGYGIYYFTRPLERFSSAQEEGIFGTSKTTMKNTFHSITVASKDNLSQQMPVQFHDQELVRGLFDHFALVLT